MNLIANLRGCVKQTLICEIPEFQPPFCPQDVTAIFVHVIYRMEKSATRQHTLKVSRTPAVFPGGSLLPLGTQYPINL